MMPQPIDFQSEVARTTAAERVQQIADRASLVGQQRAMHEVETQRIASENQVHETNPKSGEVERDLKRRNPFMGRRKRRGQADEEDVAKPGRPAPPVIIDPDEEHHLNIKI